MHQPGPCARASCEKVTIEAPHFALHLHSSQLISSQLFSPNLTSSQLFASHLLSSQMSSKFFSTIFISSEHSSTWKGKLLHTEACTNMSIAVMTIIYLAFLRLMPNSHQLSLTASMQVPLPWYFININKAAQLPKTMGPRTQPQHQGTLMQPLQGDIHCKMAKAHVSTHMATQYGNIHATIPMRSVSHHVSKSPLLTTYPSHHHPKSPLPWATTSLSHHFPKSTLPKSPLLYKSPRL